MHTGNFKAINGILTKAVYVSFLLRPKILLLPFLFFLLTVLAAAAATPVGPTYNKDILPIIEVRCQTCHRPGEIGPMPLITYEQTKPYAKAIQERVKARTMPPWYSDKCCGQFSTSHILKDEEIALIDAWVKGGAIEGKKKDARSLLRWTDNWRIDGPSVAISLPRSIDIPANSSLDTQFVILTLDLAEDRWAGAVEIHPSDRSVVDHAVVYVRPKTSRWLRNIPPLTMYAPKPGTVSQDELAQQAAADILAVYTPASPASVWPFGMGKKMPAGADLVLEIHYASKKTDTADRTSVGINFLKDPPKQRVVTLEMQNRDPGSARASASGVLTRDVTVFNFFPLMRRGKAFEFAIEYSGGRTETLQRIEPYDSAWQQSYPLKSPRALARGTKLLFIGEADALTGYFDVVIDASGDKLGLLATPVP
jgi:hypothetical protein